MITKNSWILKSAAAISICFASLVQAQDLTLDFDTDANGNDIVHGQVIDNEYADFGVEIWAENYSRGPDIAAIYSSSGDVANNRDPDLRAAWDGGNAQNTNAGNLLIIQENSFGCGDGVCNRADDEGSRPAGSLNIDFNREIESISFDLVDVEQPEQTGAGVSFFDQNRSVIDGSAISFVELAEQDSSISWGDNFFNSIGAVFLETWGAVTGAFGVSFDLGGSGAIDNVAVNYKSVPELDAAMGPLALTLLAALMALKLEGRSAFRRFRKK